MFKSKITLTVFFISIALLSCDNNDKKSSLSQIEDAPGVEWFDWANDPLEVNYIDGIESNISSDTLELMRSQLYDYFHHLNTGDSLDFFKYIDHFPTYMKEDTAMMNFQLESTLRWKKKGMINTVEFCEIDYVSDWKTEEGQHVALLGATIDFYQHFMPNFEGNPEGMKFVLSERYGADALTYTEEFKLKDDGDSVLIRNWRAHASSGMFVLYESDSERNHFNFLPQDVVTLRGANERMPMGAMLNLLRERRGLAAE